MNCIVPSKGGYSTNKITIETRSLEQLMKHSVSKGYQQWLLRCLAVPILFDRQRGICPICEKPLQNLSSFDLDHIQPRKRGGSDDIDNLRLIHVACHRVRERRGV
jgi:5-methylcytosine-specific restriction endonuclease McrA